MANGTVESGETRALKLSNLIAIGIAVIAAAVTWGVNEANIETLEHRADQQSVDIHSSQTQLAAHDRELAVVETKLDYISGKLDEIAQKLDSKP